MQIHAKKLEIVGWSPFPCAQTHDSPIVQVLTLGIGAGRRIHLVTK
jgi:hypothetical protein